MYLTLFLVCVRGVLLSYLPAQKIPPSQRAYSMMDYSSQTDTLLLFGGIDSTGPNNDLWSYSLNASDWQQIVPYTDTLPGTS